MSILINLLGTTLCILMLHDEEKTPSTLHEEEEEETLSTLHNEETISDE